MRDLVTHDMPESAAGGIERIRSEAIVTTRSFRAGFNPAFSVQHFEVPANGRLGKLEDRPELVHAQLVPLEGEQKSAPRRVSEGCHLAKKRRGGQMLNPFIRIEGYIMLDRKSSSVSPATSSYLPSMISSPVRVGLVFFCTACAQHRGTVLISQQCNVAGSCTDQFGRVSALKSLAEESDWPSYGRTRSEEHTSELQSQS